jgi:hypothetical protein
MITEKDFRAIASSPILEERFGLGFSKRIPPKAAFELAKKMAIECMEWVKQEKGITAYTKPSGEIFWVAIGLDAANLEYLDSAGIFQLYQQSSK